MATSSIQAYGGSAMNGGVNINDVRKLIFYHNNEHTPFAVYDPINDDDDTAVSVEQTPEDRLVPPLHPVYDGHVVMCFGSQNPSRLWMPIVMRSESDGPQQIDQYTAARLNAVGAFGTTGNCQLATEYDLTHGIVKFQTKVGRFDNNPFVGDVLPRVIEQYTKTPHPKVLLNKSIDGKPYPICDFEYEAHDLADMVSSPNEDEEYNSPRVAWRRVYVDRDLTIKGFVLFDRFNTTGDGSVGAVYEIIGDQVIGIHGSADFTETVLGILNPASICRNSMVDPNNAPTGVYYYGHQFLYNDGTFTLQSGKNYLFPVISKADNHNTDRGCGMLFYKHAWPVTPSTEKWGAEAYGVPFHSADGSFFKAQVLQLILEDDTRIFI